MQDLQDGPSPAHGTLGWEYLLVTKMAIQSGCKNLVFYFVSFWLFELSVMCCCPQILKFCQDLNLVLVLKSHWKVLEEFLSKGLENFVVDIKLMPFRLEVKTHKMPFWLLTKNSLLETFSLIFIVTLIFYSW